jgi:hypothetical protein
MRSRGTESEQPQVSAGFDERSGLAPVVTVPALYGAGGSVIGPQVAQELLVRAYDSGGVCSDAAATKETRDRHAG